jgi:hypothetical protein
VSFWRKIVSTLCLLFMANMSVASTCALQCAHFSARPHHHAGFREASHSLTNHHSGHHSEARTLVSPAVSMQTATFFLECANCCKASAQVASEFKFAPEKSETNLVLAACASQVIDSESSTNLIQVVGSPPLLISKAPLQTSLRI